MSQIYEQYKSLKKKDKEKMYLFRSGNFYIFLGDDVDKINEYVVLKKTAFCKESMKCGFPVSRKEEYLKVFSNHHLDIQLVDKEEKKDLNEMVEMLKKIDLDHLTPIKALNILYEIRELL